MEKNNEAIKAFVKAIKSGSCNDMTDEQLEEIVSDFSDTRSIKAEYSDIKKQVGDIGSKVDRLFDAICGDSKMGHKGVVRRIDDLEEWRKGIDSIKWKAIGILGAAGLFSQIIYYIIEKHL